jgi:hypothetical protein
MTTEHRRVEHRNPEGLIGNPDDLVGLEAVAVVPR